VTIALAAKKTKSFKSFSGTTMVLSDDAGGADTSVEIAPNATVTLDGNNVSMDKLRAGDTVQSSGNPATSITATR
jgi:hypothetical protein